MEKTIELQTLDDELTPRRADASISDSKPGREFDRDQYELARAGKEQVLKRRFGLVSMTGLSCGLMCTWETLLVALFIGLQNGGPAGLIYGFFLIWIGNLSVFITIGELSSAIPTAGGQYHWVALLAPRSTRRFFSYMTGWLTVVGWIAALTAVSYFVVDLILKLVELNNGDFHSKEWQGTLLVYSLLLLCVAINIFVSGALPAIEVVVLIFHILGFFGILVPLVYLSPNHKSAREVFTSFSNDGGWDSKTLAFFIGLQGNALAFVGTDSAVHMSEEVRNASVDVPKSMIYSLFINGCLALGMLFAVLFSLPDDIPGTLRYPFVYIFESAVGSTAGATIMVCIIIVLEFCSALGCLAAASRMTWSFARDRGLPFWPQLSKVDPRTTIPMIAIVVVTVFSALLAVINFGNYTAFSGVISMVLEGFYISYLLAIGLLLWRRLRGDILDHDPDSSHPTAFTSGAAVEEMEHHLTWGPWRLKGALGVTNNVVACCYLLLLIFFSFWPAAPEVQEGATMNWAVLVTGAVALFSVGYYAIWARKCYKGPRNEIDLHTF